MADPKLKLSLSPHGATPWSTAKIMWTVVAALLPALIMSVVVFGPSTLLVVAVAVGSSLLFETVAQYLMGQIGRKGLPSSKPSISDGSAALTGLLLAFNLSATIPLWQVVVGAFFAIMVGKMVFGGLGQNPFNPALAGRAFMMASFPTTMTVFPTPFAWMSASQGADVVSAATALGLVKEGASRGITVEQLRTAGDLVPITDLFFGFTGGSIGEVSAIALLAGGLLLLLLKIISWETPLMFLAGLASLSGAMWLIDPVRYLDPIYHLVSGGAMLAAFFMITDMVTSPMTKLGRLVYAYITGLLTATIRLFGGYPEGASYAILIMNAFVPLFDRLFPPRRFGLTQAVQGAKA